MNACEVCHVNPPDLIPVYCGICDSSILCTKCFNDLPEPFKPNEIVEPLVDADFSKRIVYLKNHKKEFHSSIDIS